MVPDAELVAAARAGDAGSLGALLERHRGRLVAIALSYLGHGPQVEDAVQEACLRAMTRLHTLRDPLLARPWLEEIQRNVCRMALRERRQAEVALSGISVPRGDPERAIEEELDGRLLGGWIRRALSRLPADLCATALLRHFGTFDSYEEIARILGVPVGTVRSRLAEVRRRLSEALASEAAARHGAGDRDAEARARHDGELLARLHFGARDAFLRRFSSDLELRLEGRWYRGRERLELEVDGDLRAGTKYFPVRALGSGPVSVLEFRIENPPDNPFRCPPAGSLVYIHRGQAVARAFVYMAARPSASERRAIMEKTR
ncbi:MAG TPA: RNA polymerase sigma factor [Planctomycetota bacterium]|nr:RNA polymerase sigma factor [Planctomycetota bacterium]